jgi:hypothetical protein
MLDATHVSLTHFFTYEFKANLFTYEFKAIMSNSNDVDTCGTRRTYAYGCIKLNIDTKVHQIHYELDQNRKDFNFLCQ